MKTEENMKLKSLTEKEYSTIQSTIIEEYNKTKEEKKHGRNIENYVDFTSYTKSLIGIFINNVLVGLIRLQNFIKGKSIDYYILPTYRGNNIAGIALNKLTETINSFCPDCENFYININPNNTSSLRVIEKLGWQQDYSLDEIMLEEGGEFFSIYKMEQYKEIKLTRERSLKASL